MENDETGINKAVNCVARFLARRDVGEVSAETLRAGAGVDAVDLMILLGSAIPATAVLAAALYKKGLARHVLVSGGRGHSTAYLIGNMQRTPYRCFLAGIDMDTTPEAPLLARILRQQGVPGEALILETASTNCGGNAEESLFVVRQLGMAADTVLLIQDPTMQRRSHASFERLWPEGTRIVSYAPFVPHIMRRNDRWEVMVPTAMRPAWDWARFLDLILGEIPRLRDDGEGYGPRGKGFIAHVDIPPAVEAGAALLARRFPGSRGFLK